jgi:hypothetical protein
MNPWKHRNLILLCLLYSTFKLAKTKGDLALESHVESPHDSPLVSRGKLTKRETEYLCDNLRLLTLGTENPQHFRELMDEDKNNDFFLWPITRWRMDGIKLAVIYHCEGYAPQVSVEFARKAFPYWCRPTFSEMEEAITSEILKDQPAVKKKPINDDPNDLENMIDDDDDLFPNSLMRYTPDEDESEELMKAWAAMAPSLKADDEDK